MHIVYCLIFEFDLIKNEIYMAADMWFNIILPSVFPYLILSRFIAESDIADMILRFPGKLISKLLGISYPSLRCVLCSVLCGYPSGAIAAASLYKNGEISRKEAQKVISYSNNAGPLFLISAVGGGMLGSQRLGFVIYIIQLISAFSYGIIFKEKSSSSYLEKHKAFKSQFDLCDAVVQSVRIIINIFGFMASAFVMSRICIILIRKFIPQNRGTEIMIKGLFEISAGVKSAVMIENRVFAFALICAFVSWSGISVILQIKSASEGLIGMKKLIHAKIIQSMISFGLGYAYIAIAESRYLSISGSNITVIVLCLVLLIKIFSDKKEHSQ